MDFWLTQVMRGRGCYLTNISHEKFRIRYSRILFSRIKDPGNYPTDKFFPKRILKSLRQCPYATDIHEIVRFPPKKRIGGGFGIHLCPFLCPYLRMCSFLVREYGFDIRKPSVDYPSNYLCLRILAQLLKSLPYIYPYDG